MSESKLPNLIIGLTVDSTGIDAGLNRAKSKISRFGGGSGGGVNSGVNNGTGGWGAGGGNDIGGAVLGAALGASVGGGGGGFNRSQRVAQSNKTAWAFRTVNNLSGGDQTAMNALSDKYTKFSERGLSNRSSRKAMQFFDDTLGESNTIGHLLAERERVRGGKLNMVERMQENRAAYRAANPSKTLTDKLKGGMDALGFGSRLAPLAVAGTAFAIGRSVWNHQKNEVARTSDLTRFKGTADYGKYQQQKYDYITKPRNEDAMSMGANYISDYYGSKGGKTATDKMWDAGGSLMSDVAWGFGAVVDMVGQALTHTTAYDPKRDGKQAIADVARFNAQQRSLI
jgi:hypothetical protein